MVDFFSLNIIAIWGFLKKEHFSYWAACGYLFFEYVRPQSIYSGLDFLPWSKIFIVIAIAGWFMERGRRWSASPLNKWMILFLCLVVLSSITAYKPEVSFFYFMNFFNWFLIYFVIINVVNTEKRLFIFLLIYLIASYKMSLFGAKTWALRGFAFTEWGLMGPKGPFENSGEFAVQMLMMFPVSYRLAVSLRPWLTRPRYWFMAGAPITALLSVLGASSRGAQIGLIYQIYHTFLRGRLTFKSVLSVSVVLALVFMLLPKEQLDRLQSAGGDKTSTQRLIYWKRGVEMIKDHPLLGVGYYNFPTYFNDHYSQDIQGKSELPHNIFIQIGTDMGVLGLGVYVSMIVCGFRMTREIRRKTEKNANHWLHNISYGYDAAFVGFLLAGQFVTIGYYPFMWIHLAFVASTRNIAVINSKK